MSDEQHIRELVRRVVGRILSERGRELGQAACTPTVEARAHGVHVALQPAGLPARPASTRADQGRTPRGRAVVTAESLADVARGGRYPVPVGAIVTDLAREEASKRDISLTGDPDATIASNRLRIAVGSDHGGFALKRDVARWAQEFGHLVIDLGTRDETPVDYPDFAAAVGRAVAQGRAELGICIDAAGIGSAMAANKITGVRAAMCYDTATAHSAREHNHANVLTLGAKSLSKNTAYEIVRTFLSTPPGGDRHARRVDKISALERAHTPTAEVGRS